MFKESMKAFVALILLPCVVRATTPKGLNDNVPWYLNWVRYGREAMSECRGTVSSIDNIAEFSNRSRLSEMNECVEEVFLETLDRVVATTRDIQLSPFVTLVETDEAPWEMESSRSGKSTDLATALTNRFYHFFDTHSLKINLRALEPRNDEVEGRGRWRMRKRAFMMLVIAFMIVSTYVVPLGFQIMAVIGGKALLLAKMALIMAIYSGYRRLYDDADLHHHYSQSASHHDLYHPHHHHRRRMDTFDKAFQTAIGSYPTRNSMFLPPLRKIR